MLGLTLKMNKQCKQPNHSRLDIQQINGLKDGGQIGKNWMFRGDKIKRISILPDHLWLPYSPRNVFLKL